MRNREYAADLKYAIATSPTHLTDEWKYQSSRILIELVDYVEWEDSPIHVFPSEDVTFEHTFFAGWLFEQEKEEKTHTAGTRSDSLLRAAEGLTNIFTALESRREEGLTVPTVLFAYNLSQETAKLASNRLGFYYLCDNPAEPPFENIFDMAAATETVRHNLEKLKNKPIRGKILFERLEERSMRQNK